MRIIHTGIDFVKTPLEFARTEVVDDAVQPAQLGLEELVSVAEMHVALHLVGVHRRLAQQAEDGERPEGASGAGGGSAAGSRLLAHEDEWLTKMSGSPR